MEIGQISYDLQPLLDVSVELGIVFSVISLKRSLLVLHSTKIWEVESELEDAVGTDGRQAPSKANEIGPSLSTLEMKRIDPIEYRYGFIIQFRRDEEQARIHGRRCYSERMGSSFAAFPDSTFPGEIAAEPARAVGFGFGLLWEMYGNSIAFGQAGIWYKQYLWRDALHPTFPVQEAIAAQVSELLSNSRKP